MKQKAQILLVEDDASLAQLIFQNLDLEGYAVEHADDGEQGLSLATKKEYDLIVLDIMLPKISGIEICRELRAVGKQVGILMLTARGELSDKVRGLKVGADDYLTKPFELMEFLARVEALLRRTDRSRLGSAVYQLEDSIQIDLAQRIIFKSGEEKALTNQETQLLAYLLEHKNQVLKREDIFQAVWGHDYLYSYRTIDTHINKLRQKIEPTPAQPRYIVTVHRVGYVFKTKK